MKNKLTQVLLFLLIAVQTVSADDPKRALQNNGMNEAKDDSLLKYEHPQIYVLGNKVDALRLIPGSAELINQKDLSEMIPVTGNEMIKKISGVHISEEEGMGLRINLGIRGLDPDRARTVHVLEDGVPVSLAPYGEPEMYYTPSIERISNIELLKGSGSILFGPQTIGGVLNYITSDPPQSEETKIALRAGNNGFLIGNASFGNTFDNLGFRIGVLHKEADKIGTTEFRINDITSKVNLNFQDGSKLGIKFSAYDESSNSTYIGITQTMYDRGEYFTVVAPNDRLSVRRYSVSLSHHTTIGNSFILKTTAFGYTTTRNWLRQDFSRSKTSNLTGVIWGDTSIAGGAIYMKNSTNQRNRQFEVAGIEPRFFTTYKISNIESQLEGGIRFLFERAFEQSVKGKKFDALSGDLTNDEIRTGYAGSFFLQNKILFSDLFSLTPGIRLEQFTFERTINRASSKDTSIFGTDKLFEIIPGIGLNYNIGNTSTIFAGVHKGYAPPRIKDAIDNSGNSLKLEAERSWNYELGIRTKIFDAIKFEATVYRLDFSNQVIPVSVSSGGSGTGLTNGGKTLHQGFESSIGVDLTSIFNLNFGLNYTGNVTISSSKYNSDRFVSSVNVNGNKLPYAPEFLFNNSLHLQFLQSLSATLGINKVGKHFGDELNTEESSPNGEIGKIPSYTIFDLTLKYSLDYYNSQIFIAVKNLTDERYIASRRPQGIKVGLPRFISAGFELTL